MQKTIEKTAKRTRRHSRIRGKISGTATCPRLSVSKSNAHIRAQLIDDTLGITLASASSEKMKGTKTERAKEVGALIAKGAKEKGVERVVFDRGGFIYTGAVRAVAESAREGGLQF